MKFFRKFSPQTRAAVRKIFLRTVLVSGGFFLLIAAVWFAAPYFVDDPMPELLLHTPVRIYLDRNGNEVFYERTYDAEWRFPVSLSEVPEAVIQTILSAEDEHFYQHGGVDYKAGLRAFIQNLASGKIVSGASTISMQLAAMADPPGKRSWFRKFRQCARARKLETLYPKQRILEEYINRIPFGGKLFGMDAAARYYFGRHAAELTVSETALLCGLPQRPNAYRPDRFPERALKRRARVLEMLERRGKLPSGEAKRLAGDIPRFRDFREPSDFERLSSPMEATFLFRAARAEANDAYLVSTSYDPAKFFLILRILREFEESFPEPVDAAAILLHNQTGEVLAHVGSLHFSSPAAGQVDAASAIRTAGSLLKPFLYREAVRAGLLAPATILSDTPLRYLDYAPGNADEQFRGDVTAAEALRLSLNPPAIRLLAKLGESRVLRLFQELSLIPHGMAQNPDTGLSLALGTAGHSLTDLTSAYRIFTVSEPPPLTRLHPMKQSGRDNGPPAAVSPHAPPDSAAAVITWILSESALPDATLPLAWKTGTSSGERDAWCVAFSRELTLGVWIGRKSGASVPGISGARSAAPCAGKIFQSLHSHQPPPPHPGPADASFFAAMRLCRKSGLSASSVCSDAFSSFSAQGVPLKKCAICTVETQDNFRILSPTPGIYRAESDGAVRVRLVTDSTATVLWYSESRYLGPVNSALPLEFRRGSHTLTAVPEKSDAAPVSVRFTVE